MDDDNPEDDVTSGLLSFKMCFKNASSSKSASLSLFIEGDVDLVDTGTNASSLETDAQEAGVEDVIDSLVVTAFFDFLVDPLADTFFFRFSPFA